MYEFGTIVLVPFPFTDLSSAKVRPAVIVSRERSRSTDVILCFISSTVPRQRAYGMLLEPSEETGLKVKSFVRFDKIVTLTKEAILGEIGKVSPKVLQRSAHRFNAVFGFQ